MTPYGIAAKNVRPNDVMNFASHPRSYVGVKSIYSDVKTRNINIVTDAWTTVKHPEESVCIWIFDWDIKKHVGRELYRLGKRVEIKEAV